MIDCNEWRTEKRHECANMGKVKRLELWWQLYRTSLPVWDLENFSPMDFCWHERTSFTCLHETNCLSRNPNQKKSWTKRCCECFNILFSYSRDHRFKSWSRNKLLLLRLLGFPQSLLTTYSIVLGTASRPPHSTAFPKHYSLKRSKEKGKGHPRTGHEGPEGE